MNLRLARCAALTACLLTPVFAEESAQTADQHFNTGLAYERLGRLDEAYTELQLASALDAQDVAKALALGVVAFRLSRYDIAKRALEQSVILDGNSIASYYELALIYEMQPAKDPAIEAWHRFLEFNVDSSLKAGISQRLQILEAPSDKRVKEASKPPRLIIALGKAKWLNADKQTLEGTNPILTSDDMLLPSGPGEYLQRIVAVAAPPL
jgi:tetratricopeptide (TPR) repeat protein